MFKFTKTPDEANTYDNTTIDMSIESNDTIWTDLLANFIEFLRGCGYQIPELEFSEVEEEEESEDDIPLIIQSLDDEVPVWYKEDCDCGYCVEYRETN